MVSVLDELVDAEIKVDEATHAHAEMLKRFSLDPFRPGNKAAYHQSYRRLHEVISKWKTLHDKTYPPEPT